MWISSRSVVSRLNSEKNDCTVVAISIAFNQPYGEVHRLLALKGRKPRKGLNFELALESELKRGEMFGRKIEQIRFPFHEFERKLVAKKKVLNSWGEEVIRYIFTPRMNVKRFIQVYPIGTFIVKIHKHVFVIKDSLCFDYKNPLWCEIEYVIKIT